MTEIKEKNLYFIDNLIVSAFGSDKDVDTSDYESEMNVLGQDIENDFKTSLEAKKETIKLEPEEVDEDVAYKSLLSNDITRAFDMFARLIKQDKNNLKYKRYLAECLIYLKENRLVEKYLMKDLLEHKSQNDILKVIADTYLGIEEKFAQAIPYYEDLIKSDDPNPIFYYQLGFLYERVFQNKHLDKQIEYLEKALEKLPTNNFVLAFLAKLYYRNGQKELAIEHFERMMKNNPTPEQIVLYCRLFMQEGDLKKGYDMYRVRFKTSNVAYPKLLGEETRWDGKKDISNSTVILHYEQGFGDSVMFIRYLPKLAKLAKKIILVVQKNLIPIFKSSGLDKYCEILSHEADVGPNIKLADNNSSIMYSAGSGMGKISHDYHIPMMDLPYIFDEAPDKMEEAGGYLKADSEKVEDFRKKYIKNNKKFKVGLSFHGTNQSNQTYRDLNIKEFMPLFKMKDVEFYSFQADEYSEELKDLPKEVKVYNLGKEFKSFEDTACAMKCMDLVVSTDNVVMNLAGALGVKTYGIFNVYPESRWYKTTGDDIGWYKSVEPVQAKDFNDWKPVMETIKQKIEGLKNSKN